MFLLECHNIYVKRANRLILEKVFLKIDDGEIVSVIGGNGAGKTTLLDTISGLIALTDGEITFQSTKIRPFPAWVVEQGIVQIPEGRRIFPYMTVLENLEIGSFIKRARRERTKSLELVFEMFPILKKRKKYQAKFLSGGEQQMLAIGRGLMCLPKLLMLDEPSLGLAPIVVNLIFKTFININREGTTILLIEQDAKRSLELSSRAYVLENRKIALEGKASDLLKDTHMKKLYLGF